MTKTEGMTASKDGGHRPEARDRRFSRRALLASIGMAGAATAASGLFGQVAFGRESSVTGSVYGSGSGECDECCHMPVTIAELRALTGSPAIGLVYIVDPGQEGHFQYDPADTASPDNTGTVLATASGARYKRVIGTDYVNAAWFGAKGDSSTDDTAAIQSADHTASALSKRLYFPAGTYMAYGLLINSSWFSEGGAVLKNNAPSSSRYNFIRMTAKDGLVLESLTFDGSVSADPPSWNSSNYNAFTGALACFIYNCTNIVLRGCTFRNSVMSPLRIESSRSIVAETCAMRRGRGNYGDAVYVAASTDVRFDRCTAEDYTRIGFVSEGGSANLSYSQCYARNGHDQSQLYGGGEYNTGFWAENSENVTYAQCVSEDNTQSGFTVAPGTNRPRTTSAAAFVFDSCIALDNPGYGIIASNTGSSDCFAVVCGNCSVFGSRLGIAVNAYHPNDTVQLDNCYIRLQGTEGQLCIGVICTGDDSEAEVRLNGCIIDHSAVDRAPFVSSTAAAGDIVLYNNTQLRLRVDRCACPDTAEPIFLKVRQGTARLAVADTLVAVPVCASFGEAVFNDCRFSSDPHMFGGSTTTGSVRFHQCDIFGSMHLTTTGRIAFDSTRLALAGGQYVLIARTAENKDILTEFANCRFEKDIDASDYIVRIQEEGTLKPTALFKGCVFYNVNDIATAVRSFVWIVRTGTGCFFADCFSDNTVPYPLKLNAALSNPTGNTLLDLH